MVEQVASTDVGRGLGNQLGTLHGLSIPVGGAVDCHLDTTLLRGHGGVFVVRRDRKIVRGRLATVDVLDSFLQ